MERRLTAILAADVVGYSRLMGADEAGTLALLKTIRNELLENEIARQQGRMVKLTGDGLLAEFSSVVNAVACAVQIQRAMRDRKAGSPREPRMEFRIGINLGDVIVEDGDLYGDGVNVAARLESIAPPGGIAISGPVRDQVGNRLNLIFNDLGEQKLKNIENPIRVYSVSLDDLADSHNEERAVRLEQSERPSIAVLPFNNMSGDPEQEYFSDGITEDIITDLSKVSGLFVTARHTAFTYKNKAVNVQQVGQELGVGFILEGSVRKAGARVRVTGQLIDSKDGGHLWADRFDRDLTDIFAIQDEITGPIVEQLKVKLLPQEEQSIVKPQTDNIEAYTYYLRGREFLHRHTRGYYELARRMFSKATELDAKYARAYAAIATCDSFLFFHYFQSDVDIFIANILTVSGKALALDESLAEGHAARGVALAFANVSKKRMPNSSGRSRSIRIRSRRIISMPEPVLFRASWSVPPSSMNAPAQSSRTIIKPGACCQTSTNRSGRKKRARLRHAAVLAWPRKSCKNIPKLPGPHRSAQARSFCSGKKNGPGNGCTERSRSIRTTC